ncbi:hypothetical protein [Thalassospira profundimaris]|uniref:hypothetical protein n=1 Tax=Thalassospira profundimaris TaxID=502049 RepID=UPI0002872543|nr:hypothetical protein [Thalassospira profundimaris]EKF10193.1 hypothetical protein TH2_02465 [Thalassospira profundimaris WP0211]
MNAFAGTSTANPSWHIDDARPGTGESQINWDHVGDALFRFSGIFAQVVSGSTSSIYSIIDGRSALPLTLQDIDRTGIMSEKLDTLLLEFSALEENWDGYDAQPVSHFAIDQTREFLRSLKTTIPEPSLAPDADGSVSIIWDGAETYLDVGFDPLGRYSFYGEDKDLGEFELEPTIGSVLNNRSLSKYLDKLTV